MKGAIFIALNQVVEKTSGIGAWEELISRVNPASGGVYVSVDSYPDEEMFAYVQELSNMTGASQQQIVRDFGEALFDFLNGKYPQFTQQEETFFGFIKSIDGTIHKEVEKLYQSPNLPTMRCEDISPNSMRVYYHSPRKLCHLAVGLFTGAANYYNHQCQIEHNQCMHNGAETCEFVLTLS